MLTTRAVMGDLVLSQAAVWKIYDDWLDEGGASYMEEPPQVEKSFRSFTQSHNVAPKDWAIPIWPVAELRLVTFDRGFQGKIAELPILRP